MADEKTKNQVIDVFVGDPIERHRTVVKEQPDPFAADGETIKSLDGLSPAFKRKTTRGLQKVHQSVDGEAKSKKVEVETLTGYLLMDVVLPPYNLDYLALLYHAASPHYAAVKAKVSNIVGLGYQLVESPKVKLKLDDAESDEEKKKLTRKISRARIAVQEWLDSCNEEDEFMEILQRVWLDYETTGNGYIEVGRKLNGEIGYIGHIPATSLRIRKQRDGFVQIVSDKVIFFRNFGSNYPDPLGNDPRPNEVIHIKKYSPTNGFYGIPDIVAAQQAVAGNEFAARFNLDYFENKAVPRYVIVSKGADLSASAQLRLTEFFETSLRGKNHRTVYVPLPAEENGRKVDFEMKPVEAGTQDASFVNYHKINVDLILMAHRVPITKVSAIDVPLAAARDLDKTFKEQVCRPEQVIFEKKVNKIVKEFTDMFLLKLNELSLTDEKTQAEIDEINVRNGIDLVNEIRAGKGLPAIKDGDLSQVEQQIKIAEATKTDPTAQTRADAKATAGQTRTRDAQRSSGATDSRGEARSPKGEGRTTS